MLVLVSVCFLLNAPPIGDMRLYYRIGLSVDNKKLSFAEMIAYDAQTCKEERCFRLWLNSLGIDTYVNNLFEDVRTG